MTGHARLPIAPAFLGLLLYASGIDSGSTFDTAQATRAAQAHAAHVVLRMYDSLGDPGNDIGRRHSSDIFLGLLVRRRVAAASPQRASAADRAVVSATGT